MASKVATKKETKKAAKPVKSAAAKAKVKPMPAKAAARATAVKKSPPPKNLAKAPAKPVKLDPKAAKEAAKKAAAIKLDPKAAKEAASKLAASAAKKPGQPAAVLKNGKIVPAKGLKPGEAEPPGDADSPLLDMSDVGVRKMIAKAKTRGYVTYDELNKVMPSEKVSSEQIEDTMSMLSEMGINVIESEEQEEGAEGEAGESGGALVTTTGKAVTTTEGAKETYDRTDDPVRMYLREMGSVELLSREGEIAIAKRIEAGRELMIGALCESPLTFEAITVWRDELNEGKFCSATSSIWKRCMRSVPKARPPPPRKLPLPLPR